MVRKTKEQRLQLTKDEALKLGMSERHAHVLAFVSVRRGLDKIIRDLLSPRQNHYSDMLQAHTEMTENSTAFYNRHKSAHYSGNKKFSRYGHLSYMYSHASLIQLIYVLLEDAKTAQSIIKMHRALGDSRPSLDHVMIEELRFSKLESAFRQDLRGNYIPSDLVETLLDALDWKDSPVVDCYGGTVGTSKPVIMDAFYVFFSSEEGDHFLRVWNDQDQRESLVDQFTYRFHNDPHINPALIDKKPTDIGTPAFEEACKTYLSGYVHDFKGRSTKRSDLDARKTRIG